MNLAQARDEGMARRLGVCAALTVPVLALAMTPALQFTNWQWLALTLTAPVAVWGAAPVHRAALADLRGAVVTADTLLSLGIVVAFGWSVYALFLGGAGAPGLRQTYVLSTPAAGGSPLYLEVAAAVTTSMLLGRRLEGRAWRMCDRGEASGRIEDEAAARRPADRVAAALVPIAVVLAAATLGFWLEAAGPQQAVPAAVAVLVIACPCAVGLASASALRAAIQRAAQLGIHVSSPRVLEQSRRHDTVILDFTGTLTVGEMRLVRIAPGRGVVLDEALRLAGSVMARSDDPVARAVVDTCHERGLDLAPVKVLAETPRQGVRGVVDEVIVVVGCQRYLRRWHLDLPAPLAAACRQVEAVGHRAMLVGWGGAVRAVLEVVDPIRPTTKAAVARMRRLGLRPVVASGESLTVTKTTAAQAGIEAVVADLDAREKAEIVRRMHDHRRAVVVLGAGPDDGLALREADLALARSRWGPMHAQVSRGDVWDVVDSVRLLRRTRRTVRQNLVVAFGCNLAALPLAVFGMLEPMFATVLMLLSSAAVVLNSRRLLHLRSARPPAHRRNPGAGARFGQSALSDQSDQEADGPDREPAAATSSSSAS